MHDVIARLADFSTLCRFHAARLTDFWVYLDVCEARPQPPGLHPRSRCISARIRVFHIRHFCEQSPLVDRCRRVAGPLAIYPNSMTARASGYEASDRFKLPPVAVPRFAEFDGDLLPMLVKDMGNLNIM